MIASGSGCDDPGRKPGGDKVELGLAIALTHAGPEDFDRLLELFGRDCRSGQQEIAKAGIVELADPGVRQAQAQATVGRERPAKPAARRPTAMADRGAQAALEAVPAGRDLVMSMMAVMAEIVFLER